MDLALNNQQRLICHKKPTNQPTNQVLFQVRVDLGVMEMKEYSTFPKVQKLEFHHRIVLYNIQSTR